MLVAEPGRMLSHYRLVKIIGEGGMGVVWQALDTRLGRSVALKLLRPELTADPERYRRFLREARAAAAVTHPNIVTIHEVAEAADTTFLCMELVEGQTLRALISGRPLPVPEALRIASEIAGGLARAHRDGIIHRDLKPENVMLDAEGRVKILDFGLAKLVAPSPGLVGSELDPELTRSVELSATGVIRGTVAYMSPEQARGEPVNPRSDLFSFGVLLYEMLTGQRPFQGSCPTEILAAVLREIPTPVSKVTAGVPIRLEEILHKCLEKNPAERPSSGDLARDLHRLQRDLTAEAMLPTQPALSAGRPRRRIRAITYASGAAALVIAASSLALWSTRRPAKPPAAMHAATDIAVLPFADLSQDETQAYFATGLHEELMTRLSKLASLKVISRTSVMGYQDTAKPLRTIASELGVGSIVEGTVQVVAGRLRVHVQLIDAAADAALWAERYDRSLDDAFAIQSEMAQKIAAAVGVVLTRTERAGIAGPPVSPQAYDLYLQGRYHVGKKREAEIEKGIRCFDAALELAPDFAPIAASLAGAYAALSVYGNRFPRDVLPKVSEYATRALALDPASAEAHLAIGRLDMALWDWNGAETNLAEALAAGGGIAASETRDNYAFVLLYQGRGSAAVEQMQQAVRIDPLNITHRQNLGEVLYYARRFDESIQASLAAIDLDPLYPQSHLFLGLAYAAQGKDAQAVTALDRDAEISGGQRPEVESWLPVGYALAGQTERSRQLYEERLTRQHDRFISPFPLACTCFVLGDRDRGFDWLAQGFAERDHRMVYLKVHPACDGIRDDPRYLRWLEAMNLAP